MNRFKSIAERVAGFRAFYQRKNERPLFGFFAGSEFPLQRYPASRVLPEHRPLSPDDFHVASYLDDCEALFEMHEACGGDFIWTASAYWGIPWLEAAIGCPLYADHASGSIFSRPPAGFVTPDGIPKFNPGSDWMCKADEFITRIAERRAGRWPMGTTRMRGIADLLAALYGNNEFVMALLEKPHEVHEVCRRLAELWIAFGHFQLDRIPLFHDGVGSFYYNMWAPSGTVWHQEDAAALLSPALYDEFIRPWDAQIAKAFEHCIVHQHPTPFVPTDFYLDMPFLALELHIDDGGPNAEALVGAHKKILEKRPLLIYGAMSSEDLTFIFENLPPQGLAVLQAVRDSDEATAWWERFEACVSRASC